MAERGRSKRGGGNMKKGTVTHAIVLTAFLFLSIILFRENQILKKQNLILSNNFNSLADRILSLEGRLDRARIHRSDPGEGVVYTPEVGKCGRKKRKKRSADSFKGGNQGYIIRGGAPTN